MIYGLSQSLLSFNQLNTVLNNYRILGSQEGHRPQPEFIATRLLAMQGLWICHEPMRKMKDQAKQVALMDDYTLFYQRWLTAEAYEFSCLFANDEFATFIWDGEQVDLKVRSLYSQLMIDVLTNGLHTHLLEMGVLGFFLKARSFTRLRLHFWAFTSIVGELTNKLHHHTN